MTEAAEEDPKVRENRLRRAAQRQGLTVAKSRRRDPRALEYGGYMLLDARTGAIVAGGSPIAFGLSIDAVEEHLTGVGPMSSVPPESPDE